MKPIGLALGALAIFCAQSTFAAEKATDAALARLNQWVQLGPIKVTPLAVLKDERCIDDPISGCPTVSDAIVRLLVERDGEVAWLDVRLGGMKRWGDDAIAVAAIKPKRQNGADIPTAAYQISLRRIPADVHISE